MNPSGTLRKLRVFVALNFVSGIGAGKFIGRYAVNLAINKILVVSDEGVENAGWLDSIQTSKILYLHPPINIPYGTMKSGMVPDIPVVWPENPCHWQPGFLQ